MEKKPFAPSLHMNGSAATHLQEELCGAAGALRKALIKMQEAAPNARDYYPQGEDAYAKACKEHEARLETVRAVVREYESIYDDLADQVDARRARRPRSL